MFKNLVTNEVPVPGHFEWPRGEGGGEGGRVRLGGGGGGNGKGTDSGLTAHVWVLIRSSRGGGDS